MRKTRENFETKFREKVLGGIYSSSEDEQEKDLQSWLNELEKVAQEEERRLEAYEKKRMGGEDVQSRNRQTWDKIFRPLPKGTEWTHRQPVETHSSWPEASRRMKPIFSVIDLEWACGLSRQFWKEVRHELNASRKRLWKGTWDGASQTMFVTAKHWRDTWRTPDRGFALLGWPWWCWQRWWLARSRWIDGIVHWSFLVIELGERNDSWSELWSVVWSGRDDVWSESPPTVWRWVRFLLWQWVSWCPGTTGCKPNNVCLTMCGVACNIWEPMGTSATTLGCYGLDHEEEWWFKWRTRDKMVRVEDFRQRELSRVFDQLLPANCCIRANSSPWIATRSILFVTANTWAVGSLPPWRTSCAQSCPRTQCERVKRTLSSFSWVAIEIDSFSMALISLVVESTICGTEHGIFLKFHGSRGGVSQWQQGWWTQCS